jgi:hypothetical protein
MSEHVPAGRSICIHGVVVEKSLRRQGVASAMLEEFIARQKASGKYDRILLISHEELISLYSKAGFQLVGPSVVQHGSRPWFELVYDLRAQEVETKSPGKPFSIFKREELLDSDGKNKGKLYCPRRQCRCLLLRAGKAILLQRSAEPVSLFTLLSQGLKSKQFNDPSAKPTSSPPDFPPSTDASSSDFWSVQPPSALTFENISFTKSVGTRKYLACELLASPSEAD